jgi:putative membrane protein
MPTEATLDRHTESAANRTAEAAERTKETAVRTTVADQRTEVSADRRTELAASRTVLAAERTYAAWVRTGLRESGRGCRRARSFLQATAPDRTGARIGLAVEALQAGRRS